MKKIQGEGKGSSVWKTSFSIVVFIGLLVLLGFSILAAITFGNADISIQEVYRVVCYELFHIDGFRHMEKEQSMMWCGSYGSQECFWELLLEWACLSVVW